MELPTELPYALVTILSILAPPVFQLVTRLVQKEVYRFLVSLALSAITGLAAVILTHLPIEFSVPFITGLFTFSSLAYKVIWKPLSKKTGILQAPPTS